MAQEPTIRIVWERSVLFLLGGAAGLALWALTRSFDNLEIPPALYLALFTFVTSYCGVALALVGPLRPGRALRGALALALPVTALVSLAGLRHDPATGFLDDPVMLSVAAALVLIATPFLSVWLQDRARWREYAMLFDTAWTITVRYTAAWAFVALFWALAFMSDALLELVGITMIETVLRIDWVRFTVTGALLGLGLAVVYELRDTLSPLPILRLLRLMVPLVLAVVAVFVLSVLLRGLSGLFGGLSVAGTLMGAALAGITLISAALDRDDDAAVATPGLRMATQLLALLLPALTVLAVIAVGLRVRQYGWTPDRVLAMGAAVFLMAYALAYAGSVLLRRGWTGRIRAANTVMALSVIGVSGLWMTPALNAFRISVASQEVRYETGAATLDQLPLWQMAHEWGRAGQAGLDRLAALPGQDELAARIALVHTAQNAFHFEQALEDRSAPDRAASLVSVLAIRPEGTRIDPEVFGRLPRYRLRQIAEGCNRQLPDGRPGCALVLGAFAPAQDAPLQGMLFFLDASGETVANHLIVRADGMPVLREVYDPVADVWPRLPAGVVAQVLDGTFDIRPAAGQTLNIGGAVLAPAN